MKKIKLTENLGLKIIALVFAAFLWLIVVNMDTPIVNDTYGDIPVTILNDDIITSAGDVYQVVGEQTVSVSVKANREVQDKISREDIVATADIREMDTSTGLVPVKVQIPDYAGDYESAEANPRNLQIQREKSGKKVLSLTVSTDGTTPQEGYISGDMTVDPDKITITGAESVLDQIDRAVAKINIEGISEDTTVTAELGLYDVNGNPVNQSQLETNLGDRGIRVSVEVLKEKTVGLVFDVSGTPAEGYRCTGCTSEPESIRICGKESDVDKVDEIDIPASVLSVSGASAPVEKTVDITPYLPDGVSLVDENAASVAVTAMVEREGTRMIQFLVSSIRINDLAEDLQVNYQPDAEIELKFTGEEDRLEILDITNAVSVDLAQYTSPGTYNVPVDVDLPEGITLEQQVTVQLTLQKKTEESAGEDGSPQGTETDGTENSEEQQEGNADQ